MRTREIVAYGIAAVAISASVVTIGIVTAQPPRIVTVTNTVTLVEENEECREYAEQLSAYSEHTIAAFDQMVYRWDQGDEYGFWIREDNVMPLQDRLAYIEAEFGGKC